MDSNATCWTLIDRAADGDQVMRNEFSTKYYGVVQKYMSARWARTPRLTSLIDDACQEVFIECFRPGGPLERVQRGKAGGFRGYLYGVARNVARRVEQRQKRQVSANEFLMDEVQADEASLSKVFDRAWAMSIMTQAGERQTAHAKDNGPDALRRVELLQLRFNEGMPIREIATKWNIDATILHREYSKARKEFLFSLREIVYEQNDGVSGSEVDERCAELIEMLK